MEFHGAYLATQMELALLVNKQLKPGNDNLQNDKYDNYYLKPQ